MLVARKAPRIAETFELDFSAAGLVITDLAIPFCRRYLKGARVAIVDDMVNVGSTIQHAIHQLKQSGAREIRVFAISSRSPTGLLQDHDSWFARSHPLDDSALRELSRYVPETLQALGKPYDLDFPILKCRLVPPLASFTHLRSALEEKYGSDRVYDVSTQTGVAAGVGRLVVECPSATSRHSKIRIYFNASAGICNVVPISIAPVLSSEGPAPSRWPIVLQTWEALARVLSDADDEPRVRLRLFLESLDHGLEVLADNRCLLARSDEFPFSRSDAALVLGPAVWQLTHEETENVEAVIARPIVPPAPSPFLREAETRGFTSAVEQRAGSRDAMSVFAAIFEELAVWVGAQDEKTYRFDWPYLRAEVLRNPYVRLRIGPSFDDLVDLVHRLGGDDDPDRSRRQVSRLLDHFIDSGAVVPTIARYGNSFYRIYRKGEADPRDPVSERTMYAWARYGKGLSLTRFAKIITILSFAEPRDERMALKADERGNVTCYAPSVLAEQTEIGRYLLRTGKLRRAEE